MAMSQFKNLTGTDFVVSTLNREVLKIKGRTKGGLREALLIIKARALYYTPVEFTNLRQSARTDVYDAPGGVAGVIYYEAAYAVYVHERMDLHHDPPTQAKFLTRAIQEKMREALEAIRRRVRIQ